MKLIYIDARVRWDYFRGRGGHWVGVCEPLGLTAEGRTVVELNAAIHEILQHLFNSLLKEGSLDAFLRKRGWSKRVQRGADPSAKVAFDIPVELINVPAFDREAAVC